MNKITLSTAAVLAMFVSATSVSAQAVFLAGAATVDITPKPGVSLNGPISKNGPVLGIHDRLYSRAIVLSDAKTTLAIVVSDSCIIEQSVYDRAKQLASAKTGIPVENMLMSATHTHAAPRAMHIERGALDDEYHELLAVWISEAVIKADRKVSPAKVGYASFQKPEMIRCRRSLCKPGSVSVNPFGQSGDLVRSVSGRSRDVIRPAGPVDPQFSILSIQHADGRPLAVLSSFNVHYCGGYQRGMVSADYFGVYSRHLQDRMNAGNKQADFVAMLANGTSGDMGSINRHGKRYKPFEQMEQSGKQLADETMALIQKTKHSVPDSLAIQQSLLELSVRLPDKKRIAWAREIQQNPKAKTPHPWSRVYVNETLYLSRFPQRYKLKMQAIRIGEIGIACSPSEMFAETGLAVKKNSPLKNTFLIELANGYSGYLPTPQQHQWGGYETWPARSSHLEVEAETKIRAEMIRLLKQVAGKSDQ